MFSSYDDKYVLSAQYSKDQRSAQGMNVMHILFPHHIYFQFRGATQKFVFFTEIIILYKKLRFSWSLTALIRCLFRLHQQVRVCVHQRGRRDRETAAEEGDRRPLRETSQGRELDPSFPLSPLSDTVHVRLCVRVSSK